VNAIDTNILVYAHRADSPWHESAKAFVETALTSDEKHGIPYHCIVEFFGIVTNARIFKNPTAPETAIKQCRHLIAAPAVQILTESSSSFEILAPLLAKSRVTGSAVHDARIAAVCLENGVRVIYTLDRDFSRFAGLRVKNPLG
jgi:toxin-antitoxin system PIN domain toxin